jgi:hypothetical protein
MELNELKAVWADHNKKLAENLQVNTEILKQNLLSRSSYLIRQPLLFEVFSAIVFFVMIAFLVASAIKFQGELRFAVPGMIAAALCAVYLVASAIKVKRFYNIDYYKAPVIKLQQQLLELKILVFRLRRIEMLLFIPFILCALPMLFKAIYGIDLFQNRSLFAIEVGLILGIGLPLTLWFNKHFYDKKLDDAKEVLARFQKYEHDNDSFIV